MVVLQHPKSAVAESFRSLRSAITYLAAVKTPEDFGDFLSFGEGKTFTSLNLASAMALGSKKTVVVGGDLRRPKLASYFGESDKIGLFSYLIGKVEADKIILKTEHENLCVVSLGSDPSNRPELLQRLDWLSFWPYLETQFDVIVFDTPPMGLVSETIRFDALFDINPICGFVRIIP